MSATGKRRKSRELAMQMLFQADVGKHAPDQVRQTFWASREEVDAETRGFSEDIFRVATARNEEIDELIQSHSANWRLSRMPAVDRNVLRMAIAELIARDRPALLCPRVADLPQWRAGFHRQAEKTGNPVLPGSPQRGRAGLSLTRGYLFLSRIWFHKKDIEAQGALHVESVDWYEGLDPR
jgi:transcription antitermination factor NusB